MIRTNGESGKSVLAARPDKDANGAEYIVQTKINLGREITSPKLFKDQITISKLVEMQVMFVLEELILNPLLISFLIAVLIFHIVLVLFLILNTISEKHNKFYLPLKYQTTHTDTGPFIQY